MFVPTAAGRSILMPHSLSVKKATNPPPLYLFKRLVSTTSATGASSCTLPSSFFYKSNYNKYTYTHNHIGHGRALAAFEPCLYRFYTPLTKQQEEEEQARVARLSESAKEAELRKLNREIARLEMLKGINTGELYTWTGKYRALARDYAMPMFVWYWTCFWTTLALSYLSVEWGGVDVIALILDWTGYDISDQVRPEWGRLGLALALNEVLEVVRLPFVVLTIKPVVNRISPTKY